MIRSIFSSARRRLPNPEVLCSSGEKIDLLLQNVDAEKPLLYILSEKIDLLARNLGTMSEKIDLLVRSLDAENRICAHISGEIDRLDGYLCYHADRLSSDRAKLGEDVLYSSSTLDALLNLGGFDVVMPTREEGLLVSLLRDGFAGIKPAVRAALRRHLRPGQVAIDGGANFGLHSLVMAEAVGPGGQLIAYEPLPHMAAAATRTLRLNGFGAQARIVQAALADSVGETTFHVTAHSPQSSIFALMNADAIPIAVPRTALDAEIPHGGTVDLVRLDIGGAEPLAWRGMSRVVAENLNIIIVMEWSASHFVRSGENPSLFMAEISVAGFTPWLLRDDEPENPEPLQMERVINLEGANLLFRREVG